MAYTNPLNREDNPLGKVVAILTCLVLAGIGFVITCHKTAKREESRGGFMSDDFRVIAVYEDDPTTQRHILQAHRDKYSLSRPTYVFAEKTGDRQFYRLNNPVDHLRGVPVPAYIQRVGDNPPTPVYAVFKGPDATGKLRQWAKDNDYPNWNFTLRWTSTQEYRTEAVSFEKPGSTVSVVGFYAAEGRFYLWDGLKVHDVSRGLTGNAGEEGESHYRAYADWLETLAR